MSDKSIFLTGGTGFVGKAVVDELLARGYGVRALARGRAIEREGVTVVRGDLFDDRALDDGLRGCFAAIHLVGIIREDRRRGQTFERIHYDGAVRVIDAARRCGVRRFIHMSALGARENSPSDYAVTKARAEAYLRRSGLDDTILRPAIIHGPGGEFTEMLAKWARGRAAPYFFMPYFGRGIFGQTPALVQPIHAGDVARAFVDCLEKPETIGRTIDLAGPEQFTWTEMYRIVATVLRGKPRRAIGIPIWHARMLTRILPASWLPFNCAQVEMASEDNIVDPDIVQKHFGWPARSFEMSLRAYAT